MTASYDRITGLDRASSVDVDDLKFPRSLQEEPDQLKEIGIVIDLKDRYHLSTLFTPQVGMQEQHVPVGRLPVPIPCTLSERSMQFISIYTYITVAPRFNE